MSRSRYDMYTLSLAERLCEGHDSLTVCYPSSVGLWPMSRPFIPDCSWIRPTADGIGWGTYSK
jgi:hypothetical protein